MSPTRLTGGLYAITPDWNEWPGGDTDLMNRTEALLRGGCRWLQYRDKSAREDQRLHRARQLRRLCTDYGARFVVNDHVALAYACGADGVHLGEDDHSLALARKTLGPSAIVGVSAYQSLERGLAAIQAGANYVAFGAAYPSSTKPNAKPVPRTLFQGARAHGLPVCAIGGITLDNSPPLIAAGVCWLAVVHDVYSQPDYADTLARARAYQSLFETTGNDTHAF